jgi:hypothetical protein
LPRRAEPSAYQALNESTSRSGAVRARPESIRCCGQHLAAPSLLLDDVRGRRDVFDPAGDLTGVRDTGVHVAVEEEPLYPLQRGTAFVERRCLVDLLGGLSPDHAHHPFAVEGE